MEDMPIIQEMFGYLLWKEYFIEMALMVIGTGRNGKGKLIELMKEFIGFENTSSVPLQDLETDQFSKCELHNKLANLCGDIDDRGLKYTGSFKMLTGRDTITADRKFKTRLYFKSFAKMIFAANNLPKTSDMSEGFFMRWILLEFPYTFVTQEDYDKTIDIKTKSMLKIRNPNIIREISTPDQMSGLLNWALEGLDRLKRQKGFSYSKSAADVRSMWVRKADSFTSFCMDMLDEQYGNEIEKSEVRHVYTEYCKKYKLKPVSDRHIMHVLTTMFGAWESRVSNVNEQRVLMWNGIKWKISEDEQSNLFQN
jgi:putative DNA primase/helicase